MFEFPKIVCSGVLSLFCIACALTSEAAEEKRLPYYLRYIGEAQVFTKYDIVKDDRRRLRFDDRGVIIDPRRDDAMYTSLALAAQGGRALDEDIRWVLAHGTPSGKVYAALLLQRYDPAAGSSELARLKRTIADPTGRMTEVLDGRLKWGVNVKLPANEWKTPEIALDKDLKELAFLPEFTSSHVGFGGQPSPAFQPFSKAKERGAKIVPQLEWISRHGSPAGQLYAAQRLYEIDKKKGLAAYKWLTQSDASVPTMFGCAIQSQRVSELAETGVKGGLYIEWGPVETKKR